MTDTTSFPHVDALRTAHSMAVGAANLENRPVGDDDILFFNDKLKYYRQLLEGWVGFEEVEKKHG